MTANEQEFHARKVLQNSGWQVAKTDSVQFNSGSETLRHAVCKMLVAQHLKREQNYRVDSEVSHPERGSIDILAYGEKAPIAVEVETNPAQDVIADKKRRYVENTPIRDIFVLPVTQMPDGIMPAYSWVSQQI